MIRITATLSFNDVMAISEELKKIEVGGVSVSKERGRGKTPHQKFMQEKEEQYLLHSLAKSTS